jgi:hypothetical protein
LGKIVQEEQVAAIDLTGTNNDQRKVEGSTANHEDVRAVPEKTQVDASGNNNQGASSMTTAESTEATSHSSDVPNVVPNNQESTVLSLVQETMDSASAADDDDIIILEDVVPPVPMVPMTAEQAVLEAKLEEMRKKREERKQKAQEEWKTREKARLERNAELQKEFKEEQDLTRALFLSRNAAIVTRATLPQINLDAEIELDDDGEHASVVHNNAFKTQEEDATPFTGGDQLKKEPPPEDDEVS